jgi:glycosyltransferase involved in cell wall biosynthesis
MDTVVLAPAGYLLDPDIGSDYERPWRLAQGLAKRGVRVVIVAREAKRTAEFGPNVELMIPPGDLPGSPVGRVIDRATLYLHARRVVYKEVASGRAFVVHHSGPCGEQSPSLVGRIPIPLVYGPVPATRPAGVPDDEWLSWLRTPEASAIEATLSKVAARQARIVAHFLWLRTLRRANAVTVEATANAPAERPDVVVIPPGVDVFHFSPDAHDDAIDGRVIAVGSLLARKGYDVLIRAVARVVRSCRQAHLVIVGSGPEEQHLRLLVGQLGIDSSVTFAGNIPRANLTRLLRSAQVFSHPAIFDTFPLAVLEAMACGLPTVVSSAGALPTIIGAAGLVHAVGNEEELAQQLLEVLSTPRLRRGLGTAARTRIVENFTWQAMSDSYLELYKRLAKIT